MFSSIYHVNGLVFWSEKDLILRQSIQDQIVLCVEQTLIRENPSWKFNRVEAPVLIPRELINDEYTDADVYAIPKNEDTDHDLVLRPETTPSTYAFAHAMFSDSSNPTNPPVCFWQSGKSFRREQDQPTKFMRLKEFHQLEFQCIYTEDTKNDYRIPVLDSLASLLRPLIGGAPVRLVDSDRVPDYAESTVDIEVYDAVHDRWMEVCSSSIRTDFNRSITFNTKKGKVEKSLKVLEIAFGLDRLVELFNIQQSLSD